MDKSNIYLLFKYVLCFFIMNSKMSHAASIKVLILSNPYECIAYTEFSGKGRKKPGPGSTHYMIMLRLLLKLVLRLLLKLVQYEKLAYRER